jgi:ABC-type multidrug transport system ATPase subunit
MYLYWVSLSPTHRNQWCWQEHYSFKEVHKCRRKIGFCPQFDALFELLTGREHLELYARIKGIAEKDITKVVDGKIAEMGLTE